MTDFSIPNPAVEPVISVERAGALLGLGRSSSYDAANRGELPCIRIGRRIVVPTAKVLALLGIAPTADSDRAG